MSTGEQQAPEVTTQAAEAAAVVSLDDIIRATMNTQTSASLKLKVLNIPKKELYDDLDKAVEFDQSQIFKKIYETEFGSPGGEPYGALIGDYEFTNHPEDIDLLSKMSNVAAAAFCPFVSSASPELFGFNNWEELTKPRDLEKIFTTTD